jgi:simple sugar transport system ATP-binding protein
MEGICKSFRDLKANDDVNLQVGEGEIHALLGENGAGKSTLMNILTGLYRPDKGRIYYRDELVSIRSPRESLNLGICMVHQHLSLVERFSVAENFVLARLSEQKPILDTAEIQKGLSELQEKYGMKVPDLEARVWRLSVGERQVIEIVRALYVGATLLVLDEPTSMLTLAEAEQLSQYLKRMAKEGLSVIFITHKLKEAMKICDNITVMRKGRVVGTLQAGEADEKQLVKMMIGAEILPSEEEYRGGKKEGAPVLEISDLHAVNDKGVETLRGLSLQAYAGEILGLAGVSGNGQRELAQVLTGLQRSVKGEVRITGTSVTNRPPSEMIELGVGYVPDERLKFGVAPDLSIEQNAIMKLYGHRPFADRGILNNGEISSFGRRLISEFSIAATSSKALARTLSGGNLQKLIVAREVSQPLKLLIVAQPTSGLDVGATHFVHTKLIELKQKGICVLLISEDLDEILELSDRIAVINAGQIQRVFSWDRADIQEIGRLMTSG